MTTNVKQMMDDARDTFDFAVKAYNKARESAASAACQEILESGKPMTKKDIQDFAGLTKSEIDKYMGEYVKGYYNPTGTLSLNKGTIHRKYALMDDYGNVDTTKTITQTFKAWIYGPADR